jgi:Protein of unknown function (DUF3105)/TIR domain
VNGDVFITFDRATARPYVEGLARHLGAAGLPVWYDPHEGGDERWAQVAARIQSSSAFVVVMTPGAERSAWVTGEINYARQCGKPILPLLLDGAPFASLAGIPVEPVTGGTLPGPAFLAHLRTLVPYTAPRKSRAGLIAGVSVAAVVALVAVIVAAGTVAWRASTPDTPRTWQEQADAIAGVQNYLVSHPEWYRYDPKVGNHVQGRYAYPVDPPAGGVHSPIWQNCMGDVYPAEIAKEQAMHSLEHGAVWVTYRPGLPQPQIDRLAERVRGVPYLFLSPYPGLDRPISLQAWGYQLKVDRADDTRIDAFIRALRINATQEPQATCGNGVTDTGAEPLRTDR